MTNRPPRSIFRDRGRKRGPVLYVTPRPAGPPPYLAQVLELGRRVAPGTVGIIEIRHDAECPAPAGGPCSCTNPEVRMAPSKGGV